MNNFKYSIPTRVLFGQGQIKNLGKEIKKLGNKVLLVYGGGSIKKIGLYDEITTIFKSEGIEWFELDGVEPNPKVESVERGVTLCKDNNIDVILAVGGGSTIDCSKVIAAAYYYDGKVWDIIESPSKIKKALPIATILTISATGSEMNCNAVISNMEINEKIGIGHPALFPKFSILDPTYTFSVPKGQTAAGSADILCHVFEVYFSVTDSAFIQNRMAEAVMKTVVKYAPIALKEPDNYEARANLMWAGSLAINGLLSYGKVTEWTMHGMEHELSAYYDITHGIGLAILMPAWMEYALNDNTIEKFAEYARYVWEIEDMDKKTMALKGIEKTKEFLYELLNIPSTLKAVGIDSEKLEIMAEKSVEKYSDKTMGTFLPLKKEDVLEIFKMCL